MEQQIDISSLQKKINQSVNKTNKQKPFSIRSHEDLTCELFWASKVFSTWIPVIFFLNIIGLFLKNLCQIYFLFFPTSVPKALEFIPKCFSTKIKFSTHLSKHWEPRPCLISYYFILATSPNQPIFLALWEHCARACSWVACSWVTGSFQGLGSYTPSAQNGFSLTPLGLQNQVLFQKILLITYRFRCFTCAVSAW